MGHPMSFSGYGSPCSTTNALYASAASSSVMNAPMWRCFPSTLARANQRCLGTYQNTPR